MTARVVAFLSLADPKRYAPEIRQAITCLKNEQEENGSWFGRWGTNYIYGTWSVLSALELADEDPKQEYLRRAADWLRRRQHEDGGWGESNDSYYPGKEETPFVSTAYQTAWAMLGLLSAGEPGDSPCMRKAAAYLQRRQQEDGLWQDDSFTAPGFPRVFYLKYHGYSRYFPLWALSRCEKQGKSSENQETGKQG